MRKPPPGHAHVAVVDGEEHTWNVETLWQAAYGLPVAHVPLEDLPWRDHACRDLGAPPKWGKLAEHCRRAARVDLSYPVLLGPDGEIVDGIHRILRAFIEDRDRIPVQRLTTMPPPDRKRPYVGGAFRPE